MDSTPKNRINRPRHTPTPKMSNRKKSLFTTNLETQPLDALIETDIDLGPMSPLEFSLSPKSSNESHFMQNGKYRTDFSSIMKDLSPMRNAKHNSTPPLSPKTCENDDNQLVVNKLTETKANKENSPLKTPNHLHRTNQIPQKASRRSVKLSFDVTPETNLSPNSKRHLKRINENNDMGDVLTTKPNTTTNAKTSLRFNELPTLSPQLFYGESSVNNSPKEWVPLESSPINFTIKEPASKRRIKVKKAKCLPTLGFGGINRGVTHNICRRKKSKKQNQIKALDRSQLLEMATQFLKRSTKFKSNQSTNKSNGNDDEVITAAQIAKLKEILKKRSPNFDTGRPLNWNISKSTTPTTTTPLSSSTVNKNNNCSDIKNTEEEEDQETNGNDVVDDSKRKFFKSKRSDVKVSYQLTDRLTGIMKRGHGIQLKSPKKKRAKISDKSYDEFLSIQHEVSDIIQMLNSTDDNQDTSINQSEPANAQQDSNQNTVNPEIAINDTAIEKDNNPDTDPYQIYRDRIQAMTTNDTIRERNRAQLDFLITYNICTEENFKIFIQEPESHAQEIEQILNQMIVVDDSIESTMAIDLIAENTTAAVDQVNSMPWRMEFSMSPTSQISDMTSGLALNCSESEEPTILNSLQPITGDGQNKKRHEEKQFYPIFNKSFASTTDNTMEKRIKNTPQTMTKWTKSGQNQMIIDAGQKDWGPRKCSDCNMFYTPHDPEDEQLHQRYHNERQNLLFKGWSDENIIQNVPEWSNDGRILLVTKNDSKMKRIRIQELLDKSINADLGCGQFEWRPTTMVCVAIANKHCIGICVAEHVREAFEAYHENGVPMMRLNRPYSVRCGISRIWVAAPYRRKGIAMALIRAVQIRFTIGHRVQPHEMAFSSPTEAGMKFAEKFQKPVLVYDTF